MTATRVTKQDQSEHSQSNQSTRSKLTVLQSLEIGFCSGASSSLINHPFQVLRARFQNHLAMKATNPAQILPPIFPSDPKILYKGFSATLLSMCCLTVTQAVAKQALTGGREENSHYSFMAPLIGGFVSAALTTPLEGAIIRQSKTLTGEKKAGVFKASKEFYDQYGLRKLYAGGIQIGVRTSIVGSGFSLWAPKLAHQLTDLGFSQTASMLFSGMFVGTVVAVISQPSETIRIEQQFSADEKSPLTTRQAVKHLTAGKGLFGLFKGGAYRIPRTAPGVFINAVVSQGLENHFNDVNSREKEQVTAPGPRQK